MRLISDQSPCEQESDSELEYPLPHPLSDTSVSLPLSPDHDIHLGIITMRVADLEASKLTKRTRRRNVLKRRRRKFLSIVCCPNQPWMSFSKMSYPCCNSSDYPPCVARVVQTSYSFGSSLLFPESKSYGAQYKNWSRIRTVSWRACFRSGRYFDRHGSSIWKVDYFSQVGMGYHRRTSWSSIISLGHGIIKRL